MNTIFVVLILAFLGALPLWPHSAHWGYYPSVGLGFVALVLLLLRASGYAVAPSRFWPRRVAREGTRAEGEWKLEG